MHNIEMAEVTEDFARCWKAAGLQIQNQERLKNEERDFYSFIYYWQWHFEIIKH